MTYSLARCHICDEYLVPLLYVGLGDPPEHQCPPEWHLWRAEDGDTCAFTVRAHDAEAAIEKVLKGSDGETIEALLNHPEVWCVRHPDAPDCVARFSASAEATVEFHVRPMSKE